MKDTKIGIVEDEILIADSIRSVLTGMNYTVPEPATDYAEAIALLEDEGLDLVLLDINLNDPENDGIKIGSYIRAHYHLPFIFLTANSDAATLASAKLVRPNAFLVKPFVHAELHAAIEIAMHNFYSEAPKPVAGADHIFIRDGATMQKVLFSDILYVESDHVYVSIYTTARRFLVRASLQDFMERLDKSLFLRIHRCYVVNTQKITSISPSGIAIGHQTLPVSKRYKDHVSALL